MKPEVIIIEEVLRAPYAEEGVTVPPFKIGKDASIPIFGIGAGKSLEDFCALAHQLLLAEPFMIFWGLSGKLADFYSMINNPALKREMIEARIALISTKQPFSLVRESHFETMVEKLGGIENLRNIPYEEALLILEGTKEVPGLEYIEPEQSEFDDRCLITCKPGNHQCGK